MPYTGPGDKSLPDYVKKLSKDKRAQWVKIFNSVYKKCIADDGTAKECESFAFKNASGVVIKKGKKKSMGDLKTVWEGIVGVFADALGVERAWSGAASNYASTEQYCSACLIDVNAAAGRDEKAQSHCMLPVKSPGSASYNFEGIQAAAGGHGISQVKKPGDVPAEAWGKAKKSAANIIISQYKKKGQTAPASVYEAAGKEQPKKKQRDMGMVRLWGQIGALLRKEESWPYLIDIYRSDAGELYIVLVESGKLYRQSITIDDETVTLGERIQVSEVFAPVERAALTITRQADGALRWTMIAATAVVNRVGEIDSTELFENLAAHAGEPDVPYPYLTFYHCGEKLRLGSIDYLARDGYVYINSGLLDQDNVLAMAIARDCASGEWGGSIHYDPIGEPERVEVAPDIFIPVYRDGIHIETSIVLEDSAAALFTILGANKEVLRMDQKVKDKLFELLGDDAEQWVSLADEVNRKIGEEGYVARTQEGGEPASQEPTPTQDDPPQEPRPPAVDQTLEMDEEALGVIVRGVADSDAFKGQFATLETSLTTLNGTLETLTKQLESNAAASTEALVKVRERLDALEKDEEQKQREWLEDVPQRQMLRVTYRPSRDNAPDGPRQPTGTLADVAESTLANMPRMS